MDVIYDHGRTFVRQDDAERITQTSIEVAFDASRLNGLHLPPGEVGLAHRNDGWHSIPAVARFTGALAEGREALNGDRDHLDDQIVDLLVEFMADAVANQGTGEGKPLGYYSARITRLARAETARTARVAGIRDALAEVDRAMPGPGPRGREGWKDRLAQKLGVAE